MGKTTLLQELQKRGSPHVPEVARQIIREQARQGRNALPRGDIPAYTRLMLSRSIESLKTNAHTNDMLLFDRGIPDTLTGNLRNG